MNVLRGSEAGGDGCVGSSSVIQQLLTPDVSPLEKPVSSTIPAKDVTNVTNIDGSLDLAPNVESAEETRNVTMANIASHKESNLSGTVSEESNGNVPKLSFPRRGYDFRSGKVLKPSPSELQELASSPETLPIRPATPIPEEDIPLSAPPLPRSNNSATEVADGWRFIQDEDPRGRRISRTRRSSYSKREDKRAGTTDTDGNVFSTLLKTTRPELPARTVSTPPLVRRKNSGVKGHATLHDTIDQYKADKNIPPPLDLKELRNFRFNGSSHLKPSPLPYGSSSPMTSLPVPPLSLPTYLQLELAAERPSPLYIRQALSSDSTYESSALKFERLQNFVSLPRQLEQILWFGALACLDAWLYSFTILPLRFLNALGILIEWWLNNAWKEAYDLIEFVYLGLGRIRHRQQLSKAAATSTQLPKNDSHPQRRSSAISPSLQHAGDRSANDNPHTRPDPPTRRPSALKNCRLRSKPSALTASHKADLLKGLLIVLSCLIMMRFDPSRMYHSIRGQADIKLYVIFNVLEIADKLLSAMGQDILECLFSSETLERDIDGRSKVIRPLWIFLMALVYNVLHAAALFYQVITLNVAVNSYSNALLTLLTSNQFVEIKGTVFKKFEKENLFQLTCADVVERFQLWLMLLIIAMRNVVEVGGLSISLSSSFTPSTTNNVGSDATRIPSSTSSIIPTSFTVFPKLTGQVLGPFLIVLGSEMIVDWLKHAYINKFNNNRPNIYSRFFDIMAKDYYSHAFADQNLVKRLGLPVFPLACLFIRASIQTYHMFLATHMPLPLPSTATPLSVESANATSTPATKAALAHIDELFRRALGRSTFGAATENGQNTWWRWSLDDVIALATMLVVFLAAYFLLLAAKLVLGVILLNLARSRYKGMKEREKANVDLPGKRYGGWGVVEVDDDKRKWIYADDPDGLKALKDKEHRAKRDGKDLERISRYEMAAKRIW